MLIFNIKNTKLLTLVITVLMISTSCMRDEYRQEEKFESWQLKIKAKALDAGITSESFDLAFKDVKLKEVFKKHDHKQYTRKQTFAEYYNNHVNDLRIQQARIHEKALYSDLNAVEKQFNVPTGYILALWGIESDYGKHVGNYYVIESLANLAYNTRRKDFFEKELFFALRMLNDKEVSIAEFKGSWAGANGQCQFMPSSYYSYAYDGNGDGKKDIWNTNLDIIASIANYLSTRKWDDSVPWGYEVESDNKIQDSKDAKSLARLHKNGIKRKDGLIFTEHELEQRVKIMTLDDRVFITFENFDILKHWNNSNYFAATVGMFAEKI